MTLADTIRDYLNIRKIQRRFPGIVFERNVIVKGDIANLKFGSGVVIQSGSVLHAGGLQWCDYQGLIEIGSDSVISPNCVLYGCGPGGIRIGKNLSCGPGVSIVASHTDYNRGKQYHIFEPVVIGSDVIIFANAVISSGVVVGDGSVIGANSVVIHDVPPHTFVAGVPGKVIRYLEQQSDKYKGAV